MTALLLLSEREAERLTDRIKLTVESIDNGIFKLRALLDEAQRSNAWQVLGFPSWTAYLVSLFDRPLRLGRDDRQQIVGYLSGEGLSTRAIAPIVGVDRKTVMKDVRESQVVQSGPPVRDLPVETSTTVAAVAPGEGVAGRVETQTPRPATVDLNTGEITDDTVTVTEHTVTEKVKTVTGLDGKTYPVKTAVDRRRSLVDDAYRTNRDLWAAVEKLRAIRSDDRYTRNKADILAALQPSVDLAREVLANL